jgi:hypothetical protein
MSSELERRLEAMFADAPEPEPGAGEEALHRALQAVRPVPAPRRGLRTAVLVFAAAVVLLAIAAGSLAAAGALHVTLGAKKEQRPVTTQLALPKGAAGISAVVDRRLSVVTQSGFRLQGLPVSAADLSPHALFVAAGIGRSLVAMAPNGRRAWSHPVGGKVVAIAWAPDGFRIAYLIRSAHRVALHVIYGNGTHDTTIDSSARAVRPSWRADNLAFAYVGAGGKAIVYDVGHEKHTVFGEAAPVTRVAFAPVGTTLAVATSDSVVLRGKTVATGSVEALGWFDGRPAVAVEAGSAGSRVRTFEPTGRLAADLFVPGRVVGFTSGLVVTRTPDRILAGWREKSVTTLLRVRPSSHVDELEIG